VVDAIPGVVDEVIRELERLETAPTRRDPPGDLEIWWE
jgi:hypothetical protein